MREIKNKETIIGFAYNETEAVRKCLEYLGFEFKFDKCNHDLPAICIYKKPTIKSK